MLDWTNLLVSIVLALLLLRILYQNGGETEE